MGSCAPSPCCGHPSTRDVLSPQSSVCAKIVQLLGQNEVDYRQKQVVILSQDSFYRVLTSEQKAKALKGQFNFDHPGELGAQRGVGGGVGWWGSRLILLFPIWKWGLMGALQGPGGAAGEATHSAWLPKFSWDLCPG